MFFKFIWNISSKLKHLFFHYSHIIKKFIKLLILLIFINQTLKFSAIFNKNDLKKPVLVAELCQIIWDLYHYLKDDKRSQRSRSKILKNTRHCSKYLVHRKKFDYKNSNNLYRPFKKIY